MMKIEQEPRTYLTIRAIGSGIQNVLFADPRNVQDVEACVRAVRSRIAARGGNSRRRHAAGRGVCARMGTPAFVKALDEAVIALMIEKASAVENLEALFSVKGVDMVQFGPADYSMSIGLPGQFRHPKVIEAERYVIETALKIGEHPRAEINHPEHAKEYLDLGVRHFCVGNDVTTLYEWFKRTGKEMGSLVGRSPSDEPIRDFRGEGGGYRGGE